MKKLAIIIILFVLTGTAISACTSTGNVTKESKYDNFAKCLTENNVKMYGAFWCPHCQAQKKMFGKSAKLLPYIECSTPDSKGQLAVCKENNVTGYPTWEFADGSRLSGEVSLETLAEKTSCTLPK